MEKSHMLTENEKDAEADREVVTSESRDPGGGHVTPDGGWGWVVVGATWVIFLLTCGVAYASTLIYMGMMERYGTPPSVTAWVFAVHTTVKMFSSPLVGALCTRFTHRQVLLVGAALNSTGLLGCAFAQSIHWVFLFYGIVSSIGGNMLTVASLSLVAVYFERRRGKAMSIAISACGVGGMTFAPLFEVLSNELSYHGAMLIFAGLSLHAFAAAAICRSLPSTGKRPPAFQNASVPLHVVSRISLAFHETPSASMFDVSPGNLTGSHRSLHTQHHYLGPSKEACFKLRPGFRSSLLSVDGCKQSPGGEGTQQKQQPQSVSSSLPCLLVQLPTKCSTVETRMCSTVETRPPHHDEGKRRPTPGMNESHTPSALERSKLTHSMKDNEGCQLKVENGKNIVEKVTNFLKSLPALLGFNLLARPRVFGMCVQAAGYYLCFTAVNTLTSGFGKEIGLTDMEIAVMLSVSNGCDVIFTLLAGVLFDIPFVRRRKYTFHFLLCCCAAGCCVLTPTARGLPAFYVFSAGNYSLLNMLYTLNASLITELVEPEKVTSIISLMRFSMGFGSLMGPSIGAALVDCTGTYTTFYYFGGGVFFLTAGVFLAQNCYVQHKTKPHQVT